MASAIPTSYPRQGRCHIFSRCSKSILRPASGGKAIAGVVVQRSLFRHFIFSPAPLCSFVLSSVYARSFKATMAEM